MNLKSNSNPNVKIVLVGNKRDLAIRKVNQSNINFFIDNNGVDFYIESSALTGDCIEDVFIEASKILYADYMKTVNEKEISKAVDSNVKLNVIHSEKGLSFERCC